MKEIRQALRDVIGGAKLMISRAVLRMADDSGGLQRFQVGLLAGETRGDVEYFQSYGLSSVAPAGSEVLVVCIGGGRDHPIAVSAVNRGVRVGNLNAGEVCLYSQFGQSLTFTKDGNAVLGLAAGKSLIVGANLHVQGDISATGTIIDAGGNTNHHTH